MTLKFTRSRGVLGGATMAVVLATASVASACIPGGTADLTKFTVSPMTGNTGDLLTATADNFERGNWPYMVKLHAGLYDASTYEKRSRCGTFGVFQVEGKTGDDPNHPLTHPPFTAPFESSGGWNQHDFSVPFVLNAAGIPPGDAHFCAIPGAEPTTSSMQGTQIYFRDGFNVTLI